MNSLLDSSMTTGVKHSKAHRNVLKVKFCILKAVYYTFIEHNFNLQEKTTSNVEVTTNLVKKFKAHFEKQELLLL